MGSIRSRDGLTARESEVSHFLASGLPQRQIGQRLSITVYTVRYHEQRIKSKIDASNRITAANRLRSLGYGR